MERVDIFIGARKGSERVKNKNTRILGQKPLISHTIESSLKINNIQNVVVSSNDPEVKEIVEDYDNVIFIDRPDEISTSVSQDIEYLLHILEVQDQDIFIKLAPTSPFREQKFIESALSNFQENTQFDSARAVELCKDHPGKMWIIKNNSLEELKTNLVYKRDSSMHAAQYQDLPKVYVQTSSLEIARTASVRKYKTKEGKKIMPIFCEGINAFAIDYETDFFIAEQYLKGNINL